MGFAMDDKKKAAILKATKNLLDSRTPDEDIVISLEELGLSYEEAEEFISEAKNSKNLGTGEKETEVERPAQAAKEPLGNAEGGKHGVSFWKSILSGKKDEKPVKKPEKEKTFIPKLRTGGKSKVKEILTESALDVQEKKETEKASRAEKQVKAENKLPKEKEPVITGFKFSSTLDLL